MPETAAPAPQIPDEIAALDHEMDQHLASAQYLSPEWMANRIPVPAPPTETTPPVTTTAESIPEPAAEEPSETEPKRITPTDSYIPTLSTDGRHASSETAGRTSYVGKHAAVNPGLAQRGINRAIDKIAPAKERLARAKIAAKGLGLTALDGVVNIKDDIRSNLSENRKTVNMIKEDAGNRRTERAATREDRSEKRKQVMKRLGKGALRGVMRTAYSQSIKAATSANIATATTEATETEASKPRPIRAKSRRV